MVPVSLSHKRQPASGHPALGLHNLSEEQGQPQAFRICLSLYLDLAPLLKHAIISYALWIRIIETVFTKPESFTIIASPHFTFQRQMYKSLKEPAILRRTPEKTNSMAECPHPVGRDEQLGGRCHCFQCAECDPYHLKPIYWQIKVSLMWWLKRTVGCRRK
jgi:hypothetical protein